MYTLYIYTYIYIYIYIYMNILNISIISIISLTCVVSNDMRWDSRAPSWRIRGLRA